MKHRFDATQPLPLFQTIAASQPQPVRCAPWLRAIVRTLACWATGAAVGALLFLAYTQSGG